MGYTRGFFPNRIVFPLLFLALFWGIAGCTQAYDDAWQDEAGSFDAVVEEKADPLPVAPENQPGAPERPPYAAVMEPYETHRVRIDINPLGDESDEEGEEWDWPGLKLDGWQGQRKNKFRSRVFKSELSQP